MGMNQPWGLREAFKRSNIKAELKSNRSWPAKECEGEGRRGEDYSWERKEHVGNPMARGALMPSGS